MPLEKWYFCVVSEEEMMNYYVVDPQENGGVGNIAPDSMRLRRDGHYPCLYMSELKQK